MFQALQYLRKLCAHPRLVTTPAGKKNAAFGPRTQEAYSPKFLALKQILLDCGVGTDPTAETDLEGGGRNPASGAGHRVLIFSQLKSVLDLVEEEVFGGMLRGVSWLRLDGSVAPTARFDVVRKFNADPSIDVLLLTTHVGGLGLNLTSADTVVFLEHDWNPQKDLQAMDRAHRLGQKRTVNVYRVLTKGTLEEKIMGLQRFKLDVANAVVNSDNMSLSAMDTGQMLELFTADKGTGGGGGGRPPARAEARAPPPQTPSPADSKTPSRDWTNSGTNRSTRRSLHSTGSSRASGTGDRRCEYQSTSYHSQESIIRAPRVTQARAADDETAPAKS